ncbi:hypothetical protein Sango_1247500 [Sesamum angolense]|uniref:Reverse transcriptase domain-containing protein n=1 Tax=Sesamum angolense TaxID=2727404 RepID=A0AAE1WQN1_9LAMI|nr:hypothetical protein Sango_1247500 [Sesamum angolense]
MKIKSPVNGEVGEVHADPFKCLNVTLKPSREIPETEKDTPVNVQPVEELLTLKLVPVDSGIGSKMTDDIREEAEECRGIYQRLVDKISRPQLDKNMKVYVDDMIVKSKKANSHVEDLEETFTVLRTYQLKLNPWEICIWGK